MAIEYDFVAGTPVPVKQVIADVQEVMRAWGMVGAEVVPDLVLDEGATTGSGLWIRVLDANPRPWDPVIQDFKFTPTVRVAFRLDKVADTTAQTDEMVRLVAGLLERISGDAVLHLGYELIWLLRLNGDVSLNERDDLWQPQRLAAITQPYRRATRAFSDT
ncbi:MAG TPA: SitI3 family protein [Pseudonocardiaceae bacterium]|jgi:hypothetical protein|nr:SitI3 family protein [Pseudonocardiaceae bacterium]